MPYPGLYSAGMLARQDALVNLASILRTAPGSDDEVVDEGLLAPTEDLLLADDVRLGGPLAWSLTVRRTGGDDDDFFTDGAVEGPAVLACRRCLTDVEVDVRAEFFYLMRHRPSDGATITLAEEEGEDDVLEFGQPVVDFAPLLLQVFAIDIPLTALCREDCKGLSLAGVNLNEHPEAADPVVRDEKAPSPFAALEDLDLKD